MTKLMVTMLSLICMCCGRLWSQADEKGPVAISYGDVQLNGSSALFDFGPQRHNTPVSAELKLKNVTAQGAVLDLFSFSDDATIKWNAPNDSNGLTTRTTVAPGEEAQFVITVRPNEKASAIFSQGKVLFSIGLNYVIAPLRITHTISGSLYTGYAYKKAAYDMCLGPAPIGYKLDERSISVKAHSQDPSHARSCGQWIWGCEPTKKDATDVCVSLTIQGHFKGGNITSPNTERGQFLVDIVFSAEYALDTPTYTLSALSTENSVPPVPE